MSATRNMISNLMEDVEFLAKRQEKCSRISFVDEKRDTGVSSNSLCSYAFGIIPLQELKMPHDRADYKACERMFNNLPKHRQTRRVKKALKKQEQVIIEKYGEQS